MFRHTPSAHRNHHSWGCARVVMCADDGGHVRHCVEHGPGQSDPEHRPPAAAVGGVQTFSLCLVLPLRVQLSWLQTRQSSRSFPLLVLKGRNSILAVGRSRWREEGRKNNISECFRSIGGILLLHSAPACRGGGGGDSSCCPAVVMELTIWASCGGLEYLNSS